MGHPLAHPVEELRRALDYQRRRVRGVGRQRAAGERLPVAWADEQPGQIGPAGLGQGAACGGFLIGRNPGGDIWTGTG